MLDIAAESLAILIYIWKVPSLNLSYKTRDLDSGFP
jgi:hypothetical protein